MKKINLCGIRWVAAVCLSLLLSPCVFATTTVSTDSPIGYWKTIDDVTNKPKAIIQISETANHTLVGQILKIYPRPGYDQNEVCAACGGDLHNQKIVGMVILNHLSNDKENPAEWAHGSILDPNNGKTYHCYVELLENNQHLKVRGYIGLPLFGRSQTWRRVTSLTTA